MGVSAFVRYDYDMIVIGAGAAGLVGAGMSALLGAKTAVVEAERLGGECTWSGCVPSKTLLRSAKIAHQMRSADRYGLNSADPEIPFARVMEHVRSIRQQIYDESDAPPHFEKMGVEVLTGKASFTDEHTIEIEAPAGPTRRLSSRYFLIATGSKPRPPGFAARCLDNESLFELTEQPQRLLVLGSGPVGIEMAQAFQRLGSSVTVVDPGRAILAKDDAELTALLQPILAREGVVFRLGVKVVQADRCGGSIVAKVDDGSTIECDAVLAAIGREPNVKGLAVEKAGVRLGSSGIAIDARCRTSQRHIFAAGDVTGHYPFTHMAEHMSKVAVTNAILRWPKKLDDKHVVWSTFTQPELARLGESEEDLRKRGAKFSIYRFPFSKVDRAIADGETDGLVKVVTSKRGRILGATILGENAGEAIAEFALAMRNKLPISRIADTIHTYPTYMLGNRRTADQWYSRQLDSPVLGLLGRMFRYRGGRAGSAAL